MHVLPDVLASNLKIVFCGTAAGPESARRKAYYAGPGNAFWPTLHEIGLTPRILAPEEYASVPQFGLGLTDLAKHTSGCDVHLSRSDYSRDALSENIARYQPRVLAFTSKRAAQEFLLRPVDYGELEERIDQTRLFVLPSPSGAARRWWGDGRYWKHLSSL